MKQIIVFCLLFFYSFTVVGQEGFVFEKGIDKAIIPFKLINNLIFIPIKVNGIELNFMLDSGVEETILFSMEDKQEVSFFNVEKITLRGLGSESSIEGLKSTKNTLEIKGLKSTNQLLYIVLDQSFNLSSHIGIPVNGIIGYNFLKNNLVEINYGSKKITVFKDTEKNRKRIDKKFQFVPITIERSKPYIVSSILLNSNEIPVKLLIDIGNSDAMWLFENESKGIKIPEKNFEDFLGKGFSGDVEGRRAQISMFKLSKFEFRNPILAFPDSSSIKNVKMVKDRAGSVGAEILRRFSIVFDYQNQKLFLRKNSNFNSPFSYNKSGVELQHYGLQWVQETVHLETIPIIIGDAAEGRRNSENNNFKYKFALKPIYIIANVRKNSPAAIKGLKKGDIVVKINGYPAYQFTLENINSMLKSDEEKWITFEIERDSQLMTFKFQLVNVL
jgi:hypothetical protein